MQVLYIVLWSFQLGAFSLPEVCSQLEKKEKSLSETQEQLNQLTVQRDALIEEIKCMSDDSFTFYRLFSLRGVCSKLLIR